MYVVMVASECAPVAKAGGLADVVCGLSREIEIRGHTVEIVLPKYDCIRYQDVWGLHVTWHDLLVPWSGGIVPCDVWFGFVHGRKCYFIEPRSPEQFFARGHMYGSDDDATRFSFFSKAALEFLLHAGKRPDIIHCHDWQTGLVPVLLCEMYRHAGMTDQRVCYTIHNFRHQGWTGEHVLWATGLGRPERFLHHDRLGDDHAPSALNLLKGGVVYSDFVTTVSPQHAGEARWTEHGHGLGHTLHLHQHKFGGVLNGVDYSLWNPEIDAFIPARYGPDTLDHKYVNKEALRERFWLRKTFSPLVAYVGRLDQQKGVHLVEHALFHALASGAQFVLLGQGLDPAVTTRFWWLKHVLNDNPDVHLEIGYTEELAHLVYAGADIVVVPSMFEPCGIAQTTALRYGTVPVVRAVGGLVDTVFDRDHSSRPFEQRNGYVFHHTDGLALESALNRALGLWFGYPAEFRTLMLNGMRCDYSWAGPGQHYLNIYDYIRHERV